MRPDFTLAAYYIEADGYGYSAIKIRDYLELMGQQKAAFVDMCEDGWFSSDPDTAVWRIDGTACLLATPCWLPNVRASGGVVSFTMFETSRLPPEWVPGLNRTRGVIVPCEWAAGVFRESGVTAPIKVVPLGIDPWDYPAMIRPRNLTRPYTFVWHGTPDMRKGWDATYKAFKAAFGRRNDVRLRLHFRQAPQGVAFSDANVTMTAGKLTHNDQLRMLHESDCYVFPSRGEGWGLPPREAAATGMPVLATDCTGMSVGIEHWATAVPVKGLTPAVYGNWRGVGDWCEPDSDALAELMRDAAANREAYQAKGIGAARWLRKNQTWRHTAVALKEAMACL